MSFATELLLSVLIILGSALVFLGSIGLVKLPDFYTRLHAPTKATTLGMGALLIASLLFKLVESGSFSFHQVLITIFLFITAPITAHMLAKTALHLEVPLSALTKNPELLSDARERRGKPGD